MNQANHPPPATEPRSGHRWRNRLLCVLAVLTSLLVALMLLPRLLELPAVKLRLQAAIADQTGGRFDYRAAGLSLWPRPALVLHQVSLTVPDHAEGTIDALSLSPAFLRLLIGDFRLARLELDSPRFTLALEAPRAVPQPLPSWPEVEHHLATSLHRLAPLLAGLELRIADGRLAIIRNHQTLAAAEGLDLRAATRVAGPAEIRTEMQARLSHLRLTRQDQLETVQDLAIKTIFRLQHDRATLQLVRLQLADPALELTGTLTSAGPNLELDLHGSAIDVDRVRQVTLGLAGDISLVQEIFDYLRGGLATSISFTTHGDSPAALGDLNNMVLRGRLQDGRISVPPVALDLTEVTGEVVIDQGILTGSGLAARLDRSTGRNGELAIGLADGQLFTLEITVDADLNQTHSVLRRLVPAPRFVAELDKITDLQGRAHGRLILGDSLAALQVRVEADDVNLTASYQRLPAPIRVTGGRLVYQNPWLELEQLNGSLGSSEFTGLGGRLSWDPEPVIRVDAGRFGLATGELYPWLRSLPGMNRRLAAISQLTGRLDIADLQLAGRIDRPADWQYDATGTVKELAITAPHLPDRLTLNSGTISLDNRRLRLEQLQLSILDAALTASGSVRGVPRPAEQLKLRLDGRMGPQAVEWVRQAVKLPELYAIRAPLILSRLGLSWQADGQVSVQGKLNIVKGPQLTADIDYRPGQIQVHQLHLKDRYSDAVLVYDLDQDRRRFQYTGSLQHNTLQALFVDNQFGSGRLEGNFTVSLPPDRARVVTSGWLNGEKLPVLLTAKDRLYIERLALVADGPRVKAEIANLSWKYLTWNPLKGTLVFEPGRLDIHLTEAELCGIRSPGRFSLAGDRYHLDIRLDGDDLDVAKSYTCLTEGRVKATGRLDFSSRIKADGQLDQLVSALRGPLQMTFRKGVIYQDKLVSRTLEVLNVTEIIKGRLPSLDREGLPYSTMTVEGQFQEGMLLINKFHMDGETLALLGNGEIDLERETIDAQLLAAPFRTVDTIVKYLPGINYLLGGSLVAIPMSVDGPLDDPRVMVLSPSSVGTSLYRLAERTITSPFKLLEKLLPEGAMKARSGEPNQRQYSK